MFWTLKSSFLEYERWCGRRKRKPRARTATWVVCIVLQASLGKKNNSMCKLKQTVSFNLGLEPDSRLLSFTHATPTLHYNIYIFHTGGLFFFELYLWGIRHWQQQASKGCLCLCLSVIIIIMNTCIKIPLYLLVPPDSFYYSFLWGGRQCYLPHLTDYFSDLTAALLQQ